MTTTPTSRHRVHESRAALWLLLACGCGMRSSLDASSANPSVSGAPGSGGLSGSGGSGGTTGGGGTKASGGCTMDANHPGYLHCGPWHGYAWTLATETNYGSTIAPADFSTASGLPFCAHGVLAREDVAVGLVGFNVNQGVNGEPPGTWVVTGTGLGYQLSNPGGSPLRIQIQGAQGYPNETWCADISGSSSGSVTWSTFNRECWFNFTWEAYDGQTPIEQVMLLVPGVNGVAQAFDVCLIGLYPY